MKKLFLSFAIILLSLTVFSQNRRGYSNLIDSTFPKISFTYNIYSNKELEKEDFALFEDDINNPITEFEFSKIEAKKNNDAKSILILWEDMYSHENSVEKNKKYNFISNTITSHLENIADNNNDYYNIATFNRDKNGALLKMLNDNFSLRVNDITSSIVKQTQSKELFNSEVMATDLYKAISDALDILKNEKTEKKGLIVFTSGLNMDRAYGAKNDFASIREKALKNEIPVYIICYPIAGSTPKVQDLAESTYGQLFSSIDYNAATEKLTSFVDDISIVTNGNTYQFSYESKVPKDGKTHQIILDIGKESINIPLIIPSPTFSDWYKENKILFLLIITISLIVIVAVIIVFINVSKKNKAKRENTINEIKKQHEEENNAIRKESQENLDAFKKKIEDEKKATEKLAKQKELLNLMKSKNLYPRLKIDAQNNISIYNISNIETSIGRTNENDLVINSPTVSKKHAKIIFNGSNFEIIDLASTNHVIINGKFVEKATLKNGDIIGLGDVIVYYYL